MSIRMWWPDHRSCAADKKTNLQVTEKLRTLRRHTKEELAQSLGLLVTFDLDLPGKEWEKADGTHDSITIFTGRRQNIDFPEKKY